jgi:glycosyltransferase involved in cell wall biosynthesis
MKHENPLVSVIIPVYNAGPYLEDAVESALEQTYDNLELIVVDDGSTDESVEICDRMAARDHRISVCHQQHAGASAARNRGLDMASGEYICFIDADDHAYGDMIRMMVTRMEKEQADVAVFNVFEEKKWGLGSVAGWHIKSDALTTDEIRFRLLLGDDNYVWRKMYRRSLWDGIRFPLGKNHEELYVNAELFLRPKKIISSQQVLYNFNHYKEKTFGRKDELYDIYDSLEAWRHNLETAGQYAMLFPYREYYRWQARMRWHRGRAKTAGTSEGALWMDTRYQKLFDSDNDFAMAVTRQDRKEEILEYYMAAFRMHREKEGILLRYGIDDDSNERELIQAALEVLCVNSVVRKLPAETVTEVKKRVEEARERDHVLPAGQNILFSLIDHGNEDVMRFKGRSYLKRF